MRKDAHSADGVELTIESRLTGLQVARLCRSIENGDFAVTRTERDKLKLVRPAEATEQAGDRDE